MEKILNFDELISDHIGSNRTIKGVKASNLLSVGENYMSDILRIHLTLRNNTTEEEENKYLIAKLTIENPLIADGSTAKLTKNEYLFYKQILPAIQDFEKKHSLPVSNFFPKFIAGRLNLNGTDLPDQNGLLILEDLTSEGFKSGDRHVGFDLNATKLILNDLAKFHAIPLAMRLLNPQQYETQIKKHCTGLISNTCAGPLQTSLLMEKIITMYKNYEYIQPKYKIFAAKLQKMLEENPKRIWGAKVTDDFETLVHCDLWTNNILLKHNDGTAIKSVFLDFQMVETNSCICDLIFFLVTSVELTCLKNNFDTLIRFYYDELSLNLDKLQCLKREHNYEKFQEALRKGSYSPIFQCVFMLLTVITAQKGQHFDQFNIRNIPVEDVPEIAKNRLCFLLQEAFQRGWLDA
ncbi:uncharacterized protein LOC130447051 [Diorhabda sublineata]|uniref:uncharacterized protein LOC130447051 n=1 Tax=Diorhabda sublineata TaxID=1163346 RepID=UPI0024E14586|nr:uncharacterized protein LOC130447051 [Diorhabda sublineata]